MKMFTEIETVSELLEYLENKLDLANRSVCFHITVFADDDMIFGSGLIHSTDDAEDSDSVADYGCDHDDEAEIEIDSIESLMLGDGESDDADSDDINVLMQSEGRYPKLFEAMLDQHAERMAYIGGCTIDNPWYIPEDDEEEE